MTLTIEIESDNAAFQDGNAGSECARILREAADKMDGFTGGELNRRLRDSNGNTVGSISAEHADEETEDDDDSE